MAGNPKSSRQVAILNSGMKCYYCGVPTAATVDHVNPRAAGGKSNVMNLVIACPYCNTRKGKMSTEEFMQSGRWRVERPELPDDMNEMLAMFFNWEPHYTYLETGSSNSRLEIIDGDAILKIRPGRGEKWTVVNVGSVRSRKVIGAVYDFLRRHYTPMKQNPF